MNQIQKDNKQEVAKNGDLKRVNTNSTFSSDEEDDEYNDQEIEPLKYKADKKAPAAMRRASLAYQLNDPFLFTVDKGHSKFMMRQFNGNAMAGMTT